MADGGTTSINQEEVGGHVKSVGGIIDSIHKVLSVIDNEVHNVVGAGWDSDAATAFAGVSGEWNTKVQQLNTKLEDLRNVVGNQALPGFQDHEAEITSSIKNTLNLSA